MKITFFDIKGFGKFNQVKITPGAGFNMIYAENEAGKSTLQTFIRAMLYGQKGGRKSKDGSLPPLKQYKPWNAEQYAGVMEYTLDNGDFYRVGRNFDKGTSNIYDKVANNVGSSFTQDSGGQGSPRNIWASMRPLSSEAFLFSSRKAPLMTTAKRFSQKNYQI
jgi:hypothetical protein